MMRRRDVLIEFSATELAEEKGCNWDYPDTDAMADEIVKLRYEFVRLRRTLAELQKPSRSVLDAANEADGGFLAHGDVTSKVLRAAVAAAEKEASGA